MSMDHWDKFIAPALIAIEGCSRWAAHYGREVTRAVNVLPGRPDFETKAEDVLREAEIELETALENVRIAREVYALKRVLETAE